jgi:hypothetical protein
MKTTTTTTATNAATTTATTTPEYMDESVRLAHWQADKLFQIATNLVLLDREADAYRFEAEARRILIAAGVAPAGTFVMAAEAAQVCSDYTSGRITTQPSNP